LNWAKISRPKYPVFPLINRTGLRGVAREHYRAAERINDPKACDIVRQMALNDGSLRTIFFIPNMIGQNSDVLTETQSAIPTTLEDQQHAKHDEAIGVGLHRDAIAFPIRQESNDLELIVVVDQRIPASCRLRAERAKTLDPCIIETGNRNNRIGPGQIGA
jgi:hypothetical protein